jgi:hypothetical protein
MALARMPQYGRRPDGPAREGFEVCPIAAKRFGYAGWRNSQRAGDPAARPRSGVMMVAAVAILGSLAGEGGSHVRRHSSG